VGAVLLGAKAAVPLRGHVPVVVPVLGESIVLLALGAGPTIAIRVGHPCVAIAEPTIHAGIVAGTADQVRPGCYMRLPDGALPLTVY